MPYVRWRDFQKMGLVIPPEDLQRLFTRIVNSSFDKIFVLEQQISAAREARDRLLPKLMNGEVEV